MPRLSRWLIRASLLHLLVGFTLGALLLAQKAGAPAPLLWRTLPLHTELLLLGWIVQLTMGVAYWILPRFGAGPARGNEVLGWAAFVLLNAGVLAAGIAPALGLPGSVRLLGRASEAAAAVSFALNAWPRVKPADLTARR